MMNEPIETSFDWDYPNIGTCGLPCDILRICLMRTRAIPDLLLKFDGERSGWVIGGSFKNKDNENSFEFKELAFIPESSLETSD